jgi:ectoine hydroxylase-related dioxygenase (phytanoyl-CoA dioxygenase family)
MRTATSDNYLTSGIAYAFHPHRDTWYSAAPCQLNWWFPIYEVEPDNVMAFHPRYWDQGIKNSSSCYNYYQWNASSRQSAAQHIQKDTRIQPKAEEPMEIEPQIRLVAQPGGVMVFSAAQMHSTVPNTSGKTRFSIDFRTVHYDDAAHQRGAVNVDSECTGTALRDFLRMTDLERVPDEVASLYDVEGATDGLLIYQPSVGAKS